MPFCPLGVARPPAPSVVRRSQAARVGPAGVGVAVPDLTALLDPRQQAEGVPPRVASSHSTPPGPALTTGERPSRACCPALAWLWPQTTSSGSSRRPAASAVEIQ